jgi:hypothetical protein
VGFQPTAIECCSNLAEPICGQLAPVRELVARIPAPRRDHRQHQDPALAQQVRIDTRIVLTDLLRCMSEVELHRSTTTRLKIYEDQPVPRAEHVARVRLAVQHLLAAALADHSPEALQRIAEQPSVCVGERRSTVATGHELLSRLDTIREMRRLDIESAHTGMQPLERMGVVGW